MCCPKKVILELCELYPNSAERIKERAAAKQFCLEKMIERRESEKIKSKSQFSARKTKLMKGFSDSLYGEIRGFPKGSFGPEDSTVENNDEIVKMKEKISDLEKRFRYQNSIRENLKHLKR